MFTYRIYFDVESQMTINANSLGQAIRNSGLEYQRIRYVQGYNEITDSWTTVMDREF